jgi:hypothetical protein
MGGASEKSSRLRGGVCLGETLDLNTAWGKAGQNESLNESLGRRQNDLAKRREKVASREEEAVIPCTIPPRICCITALPKFPL